MAYLGKTPSQGTRNRFYFTASGGETSLSGADDNGNTLTFADGAYVDVSVNGISLVAGTDYNTSTDNTIAGLTALSASDVVEIVAYDVFNIFSGSVNGPLTASAFIGDGSALTNLPAAGIAAVVDDTTPQLGGNLDTNGNDITFGDLDKAIFGAGSDLSIYHNGANSYIEDVGTGNLHIKGQNLYLEDSQGYDFISMIDNGTGGTVSIKHLGSTKLATTATGVDVTGDVSVTGGVYVGGTGSANYLNDFEEGTWTPVIAGATFGDTGSSTSTVGFYQKIGNTVHIYGYINQINTTGISGSNAYIQGIPFLVTGGTVHYPIGSAASNNISYVNTVLIQGRDNQSALAIIESSPSIFALLQISDITSGSANIYFSLTYRTS